MDEISDLEVFVEEILERLGASEIPVRLEFSNRFTARLGDARFRGGVGFVRLSRPLWGRASGQERLQTVAHEVCHVVQRSRWPHSRPHGREWKRLMWQAGFSAERCHSVDRSGLRRTQDRYEARCGCGVIPVTMTRIRRIAEGTKYKCNLCGEFVVANPNLKKI